MSKKCKKAYLELDRFLEKYLKIWEVAYTPVTETDNKDNILFKISKYFFRVVCGRLREKERKGKAVLENLK